MAKTLTVTLAAFCSAIAFAQPIDVKLNDPGFNVTDLATTRRLFRELGFLMHTGNPTGSAILFRDGGGFEFRERSDRSEGPRRADLEIVSADEAAQNLRATGLRIAGPTPGSRVISGETLKWFTLEFEDKLDSRPVYMVQILNPEVLHPSFDHPNSASSLSAILVAVNDLEKAAAGYASIAKLSSREVAFPEFGAVAKEIVLARGSIFLLQATGPSGPTAQRIKTSGEGLFGMRLAVTDLGQARKVIGGKNVSKDNRTVLVSPENAAGAWLEFHAK
jgi:hypothetical protein